MSLLGDGLDGRKRDFDFGDLREEMRFSDLRIDLRVRSSERGSDLVLQPGGERWERLRSNLCGNYHELGCGGERERCERIRIASRFLR